MFAEVYIDNGDFSSALPLLEHFENIHSSSSRGFYQMGYVKLKLGSERGRYRISEKSDSSLQGLPAF